MKYFYKVQILEEENARNDDGDQDEEHEQPTLSVSRRESGRVKEKEREKEREREKVDGQVDTESKAKWAGSLMEVQCNVMS